MILPLVNKEIPVVADTYVEMDFGTGVVKITPAHDPNDFEVGLRHDLPVITVTNEDGHMNELAGKYAGMTLMDCRKAVVKDLEEGGYLVKTEPLKHNVGSCYRCRTVIEPRVSQQWFVKMKPLAEPAIEAVRSGRTKFVPERFDKVYYNWMENIRDWCISRQLWWGHRIPAWYCADCGEIVVSREDPAACPKCGGTAPAAGRGHPGHLVLLGAVAVLHPGLAGQDAGAGVFLPDQHPGDRVRHHLLLGGADDFLRRGAHGGGPLRHGAHPRAASGTRRGAKCPNPWATASIPWRSSTSTAPTRCALRWPPATARATTCASPTEKVESSRNFANKLWNAARFILMNLGDGDIEPRAAGHADARGQVDSLASSTRLARAVTDNLEKFELGLAVQKLYDFIWDQFCDWYIELCKTRLQAGRKRPTRRAGAGVCHDPDAQRCCIPSCPSSPRKSGSPCPMKGRR